MAAVAQSAPPSTAYSKQAEIKMDGSKVQILANNPRPLLQILDALYRQYGWLVSYEDPRFVSPADLMAAPGEGKKMLPAGGKFSIELAASETDETKALQSALDAYNASENPGRFDLRKIEPASFTLVGVQARNAAGKLAPQHPVLDAPITVLKKKRTVSESLTVICRRVSSAQGIRVTMGVSPRNVLEGVQVEIGGPPQSARNLIQQALASAHRPLYWRLLFDPSTKTYLFNVHLAPPAPAH
jgi:hypothetical protein